MAQDDEQSQPELDATSDLDLVSLYSSQTADSEIEAEVIKGLMDANGIPAVMSVTAFPNLGVEVRVPRAMLPDAERIIQEAQAAGPQAAAEAEAASEEQ